MLISEGTKNNMFNGHKLEIKSDKSTLANNIMMRYPFRYFAVDKQFISVRGNYFETNWETSQLSLILPNISLLWRMP